MTQSGQGEEPSARPAREGIVLPSDGGEPLLPGMTSGPVAPGGTDGRPPAGGFPASAPPEGQTWGTPWGPEQQAPAPAAGQEWPAAGDGAWQQQPQQQPSWDAGGQTPAGQGPGPLPPEGTPSPGGYPAANGTLDAYGHGAHAGQQGAGYGHAGTDGYGYGTGGAAAYGGHGAGYGTPDGGGYGYPAAQGAPLPPPAPDGAEGATQFLPPVAAGGPDEGATQYIPPVAPGALPPEMPAAHDAEATRNLGMPPQPAAGPGPLPQPGNPDAEPTQFIAPITDQGPPQPYGAAPDDGSRQPPAEFDNLFRNDDGGAAGSTQQLPRMEYGRPARADRTPPGPPTPPAPPAPRGGRGGGGGGGGPRWPLIAAVGVGIAVVGVGAGALLGSGGGDDDSAKNQPVSATAPASEEASASPSVDPAREQAVELDKLLAHSGDSRSTVISAVEDVKSCRDLGKAASDLREAAKQRNQLVTDLSQLSVDKLPEHQTLTEALKKAWKASASADDHYARWAEQTAGKKGCKKGQARSTRETEEGNRASGTATEQKKKASKVWNEIARQYGLTERAPTQL
ncbi:hypothetical protein LRR80_01696 [Streptomyces sp. RO-S4]|uniref:hypothetical protein n=1 Tax=Streptomyces sp. RO-S4 TaxID=2902486 RepID=UPI00208FC07A|nr:hypothetical protein [Streptomyces sp. RO-S4]MCO4695645.1 hypothetical protein [Streptomyces sp. RO-S4]